MEFQNPLRLTVSSCSIYCVVTDYVLQNLRS